MFKRLISLLLSLVVLLPINSSQSFVESPTLAHAYVDDYPIVIQRTVNDPLFSSQTNLNQINIPQAWDVTTGKDIIIALIDTGIAKQHEDLIGKLWVNTKEIPNNHRDDDGNGYVDDVNGYNFRQNNSNITDDNGHGTSVASVIAANTNNTKGIAGINWHAKIMVLKALNELGGGEYTHVARAVRYAVDNGAKLINMSFGTHLNNSELEQAVNYAISKGVAVIAAAGNNGQNKLLYPAAYSGVIAVGAVDSAGARASFSNFGTGLDVMAPGLNIVSANYEQSTAYSSNSGTSYAAAHITGLASLILSLYPSLSPQEIRTIIRESTKNKGNSTEYGEGIIDAALVFNTANIANIPLSAQITASTNNLLADDLQTAKITITVTSDGLPVIGRSIGAQISGGQVKINNSTIYDSSVNLGVTNTLGKLYFTVSSYIAGTKTFKFVDEISSQVVGSYSLVFSHSGPIVYDAMVINKSPDVNLELGDETILWVELKNTGNTPWLGLGDNVNQFRLGTYSPLDRNSKIYHSGWLSSNRVTTLNKDLVNPNEVTRISFTIKANQLGSWQEQFNPVIEYKQWLPNLNIIWNITVSSGELDIDPDHYQAQLINRSSDLKLNSEQQSIASVTFKNVGNASWFNKDKTNYGFVKLGTANPTDRVSSFICDNWLSSNRVIGTEFVIAPNEQLTLGFSIIAPTTPGVYYESFKLVSEHLTWFGPIITWKITVI